MYSMYTPVARAWENMLIDLLRATCFILLSLRAMKQCIGGQQWWSHECSTRCCDMGQGSVGLEAVDVEMIVAVVVEIDVILLSLLSQMWILFQL